MKKIIFSLIAVAMMVSCTNYKAEKQQLETKLDSMSLAAAKTAAEYEEMLSLMNEVEDGFREMKAAENYLTIQSVGSGEMQTTTRERVKSDLSFVKSTLERNREQLANLQKKLQSSNYKSSQLQKRLDAMIKDVEEKTATIASLQGELSKRDASIRELQSNVSSLKGNVAELQETSSSQQKTIKERETELNTAWYVFGTTKELRDWKVIEGGTIFKRKELVMDKGMFTKIDIREVKEIPLKAKKAKLLTEHPVSSYSLQADENKDLTLVIIDSKEFWSISKYLVINL